MRKNVLSIILVATMTAGLVGCAGSNAQTTAAPAQTAAQTTAAPAAAASEFDSLEPVELILADTTSPGTAAQMFGYAVTEKVEALTGGKLTIDYHPNSELGGDGDIIRQEQSGDIHMHISQTAPMVSFVPEMGVFDLPMVFSKYNGDQIDKVLNNPDSEFRKEISQAYEKQGLHLLGFLQNATYRLTTSNKELRTLADFKDLQIRTMENTNHMGFWSAIDASPTPIAYSEVFISLQNGTIDAQENPADICASINLQDVQKYLACTNHILFLVKMSINKNAYDNLAPAYQKALDQAVSEAIAEVRPQLPIIDQENKKKLQDGGMTIIEYGPEFFDEILALPAVKELYKKIDDSVGGLGTVLQNELAALN